MTDPIDNLVFHEATCRCGSSLVWPSLPDVEDRPLGITCPGCGWPMLLEGPPQRVKPILDACCGGRQFWHDKNEPGVVFMDLRVQEPVYLGDASRQWFSVTPTIQGDFRRMPFADATFRLVVFDPPHLDNLGRDAWLAIKYGRLFPGWEDDITAGFAECFRVCDPSGFVIFKWSEVRIPVGAILPLAGRPALFGHRTGKGTKTHWLTYRGGLDCT